MKGYVRRGKRGEGKGGVSHLLQEEECFLLGSNILLSSLYILFLALVLSLLLSVSLTAAFVKM